MNDTERREPPTALPQHYANVKRETLVDRIALARILLLEMAGDWEPDPAHLDLRAIVDALCGEGEE